MRAAALVDNTEGCGLSGEWGLSIHTEHAGLIVDIP